MWRTHSCVPRRDFLDACLCDEIPKTSIETSLDTARKSACATSRISCQSLHVDLDRIGSNSVHSDNHVDFTRRPQSNWKRNVHLIESWKLRLRTGVLRRDRHCSNGDGNIRQRGTPANSS